MGPCLLVSYREGWGGGFITRVAPNSDYAGYSANINTRYRIYPTIFLIWSKLFFLAKNKYRYRYFSQTRTVPILFFVKNTTDNNCISNSTTKNIFWSLAALYLAGYQALSKPGNPTYHIRSNIGYKKIRLSGQKSGLQDTIGASLVKF